MIPGVGTPMAIPSSGTPIVIPTVSLTAVAIPTGTPTVPPEAAPFVEAARSAVAKYLGVAAGQVVVTSFQAVEWSDSSLGCPQSGMSYTQAVTPGYLIRLTASGQTFEFHTDRQGMVVTCGNPQPPTRVTS